jgi:hypothetical protein
LILTAPASSPGAAVLLVGVLHKVGTHSTLRYCFELFPAGGVSGAIDQLTEHGHQRRVFAWPGPSHLARGRGRHGWQAVTNAGTALPVTGTGRVTAAGNARTRDAAAVSLLRALQRQQEDENRQKGTT